MRAASPTPCGCTGSMNMARDARAERRPHPRPRSPSRDRRPAAVASPSRHSVTSCLGQVAEVVLKRVGHPAVVEAHVRRAIVAARISSPIDLVQQRVELAEVAEHDVAAQIPGEAGRVDHRGGEPAGVVGALEDQPVSVTEAVELTRARQATRARADDHDATRRHAARKVRTSPPRAARRGRLAIMPGRVAERRDLVRGPGDAAPGAQPIAPEAAGRNRRQADPLARDADLHRPGFRRFVLLTGYQAELIEAFATREQWPGDASVECLDTGLDTPDRRSAAARRRGADRRALLRDLRRRRRRHRPPRACWPTTIAHSAPATMTVVRPELQFGVAELNGDGLVRGFVEKPRSEQWINGGFFCFEPAVLDLLDDMPCSSASRSHGSRPPGSCGRSATRASGTAWTPTRTRCS